MWKLRPEQWAKLVEDRLSVFAGRAVPFLREEAPEVVAEADDEEVCSFALRVAQKGVALGFEDPYCLQQLVLFTAWYGEGLWDAPWARKILEKKRASELAKIARLEDHLLGRWGGSRSEPRSGAARGPIETRSSR